MKFRAITKRMAEWIGNAASVAGGYIAVNGPRLAYISADDVKSMRLRIKQHDAGQVARVCGRTDAPEAEYLRCCHQIDGGHGMLTIDESGDRLILAVPDGMGLADEGIQIPEKMMSELRPILVAAGYEA